MTGHFRTLEGEGPEAAPNGFAEEAARVWAAETAAAADGKDGDGRPDPWRERPGSFFESDEGPTPIIEPEERPGRPRRAWPWALVTIVILVLIAAAYTIASDRSATARPDFGTVPDVLGLSEAKAIDRLQAAGFGYRVEGRPPSAEVDEGGVVRQTSTGGAKLEKGETVGIWVSAGTGQIEVPRVVGLTRTEAIDTLSEAGLETVARSEVSTDLEVGRVLRQNPEPDERVDAGTTVTITVAAITNTVKIPTLNGMSQENAVALITGMNLVAVVKEVDSALPGGVVDRQEPAGGSEVQPGTTVTVFVSDSAQARTVFVPAVAALGLTEAEAKAILGKYRLKPELINLETAEAKPGVCIYQDPAAGAEVKPGSVVKLTIARKPQTTTTVPSYPPGGARYDHTEPQIVKTGSWTDFHATAAHLGSYGRSSARGTSATIHFTGTRLDWIAMMGTTTGIVDVYLDGAKKATINLAAATPTYNVGVWSTGNLPRGRHRVSLVLNPSSPSGKFLTLDAVDIWGTIRSP